MLSILREKVLSAAPVKCFFLSESNNSDSVFFWECQFGIDQRSQFDKKHVTKIYFAVEIWGRCLLNVKKCFQTQILLFSRTVVFERLRITVWEGHSFKNVFCYGSFRYMSTSSEKVFSGAPLKCFFFMAQITQILMFSGMLVLERSKITVWVQ